MLLVCTGQFEAVLVGLHVCELCEGQGDWVLARDEVHTEQNFTDGIVGRKKIFVHLRTDAPLGLKSEQSVFVIIGSSEAPSHYIYNVQSLD